MSSRPSSRTGRPPTSSRSRSPPPIERLREDPQQHLAQGHVRHAVQMYSVKLKNIPVRLPELFREIGQGELDLF
jgi:hypothetical protein